MKDYEKQLFNELVEDDFHDLERCHRQRLLADINHKQNDNARAERLQHAITPSIQALYKQLGLSQFITITKNN